MTAADPPAVPSPTSSEARASRSRTERVLDSVSRRVARIAALGVDPRDSDLVRGQKITLTLAAMTVTLLSFLWVGTYLALGLPTSAAIPFAYQIASVAALGIFSRTKDLRLFRSSQLVLMLALPFLLQWSLGGYVASSAVSLWALVAVFGAIFFMSADAAVPWFVAFAVLTVVSGFVDPRLAEHAADIPAGIQLTFFVLTILGVALTAYVMLQFAVRDRDAALGRSDRLLLNVLPPSIAERLKRQPGVIADRYDDVTVLFADVVDFTPFAERMTPERLVGFLDELFSTFDRLAEAHRVEKIKTIGDAYMAAGGLPERRSDHALEMLALALDLQAEMRRAHATAGVPLELRIGLDSGPVVAGVIGRNRFIYDLWGDTVNTASRMESHGVPGRIQVTEATYQRTRHRYRFEDRGEIEVKGKARQRAYLLVGPDGASEA